MDKERRTKEGKKADEGKEEVDGRGKKCTQRMKGGQMEKGRKAGRQAGMNGKGNGC